MLYDITNRSRSDVIWLIISHIFTFEKGVNTIKPYYKRFSEMWVSKSHTKSRQPINKVIRLTANVVLLRE